jgi:hypothetical protein
VAVSLAHPTAVIAATATSAAAVPLRMPVIGFIVPLL